MSGRIEVVANIASGGVGPDAPQELERIFAEAGLSARICAPPAEDLTRCLREAVDANPELLVLLAGDGTIRAAAEACGPDGPTLLPLPGGTMNMLPHAIYGPRPWQDTLKLVLDKGHDQAVGGGEVEGRRFLVAAILGSPALWAPAREAVRYGHVRLAVLRARRAFRRAFSGRLRYNLDAGGREKAEAITFMCPLTSRRLDEDDQALEAAALDINGALDAFRLGFHFLTGDWRDDPGVDVELCKVARVWAAHGIPALLDGESVRLKSLAEVRFVPDMIRVRAIPKELKAPHQKPSEPEG